MTTNRASIVAVAAMVAAILVIIAAYAALPVEQRQALWFEGAKAAFQVVTLAFFGVIIAGLVRSRDERRTHDEHLDADRRGLLRDTLNAYNTAKRVRRSLRGAGLVPPSGRALTAERLGKLDEDIATLSDTQLDFERLAREVEASDSLFSHADTVRSSLRAMEDYVNGVIKDWESGRANLVAESSEDAALASWHRFGGFVASVHDGGDFGVAAKAMQSIEDAIRPDLLGAAAAPRGDDGVSG